MTDVDELLRTIRRLEQRVARLEGSPAQFGQNVRVDSSTDSVLDPMRLARETTGTAADGIGVGLPFYVQDASGNVDEAGSIDVVLTTAAHATQAAELRLNVMGTKVAAAKSNGQVEIPVATGTAPLGISSTTVCTNLNADTVDGIHAADISGATVQYSILNPPPEPGAPHQECQELADLDESATVDILHVNSGPGFVTGIWMAFTCADWVGRERSVLNVYIDSEVTPRITSTLAGFFAGDYAPYSYDAGLHGVPTITGNNIAYYHRLTIPWSSHIQITLTNASTTTHLTPLWTQVQYNQGAAIDWGRKARLHAVEVTNETVAAYAETTLLDVHGLGLFHGLTLRLGHSGASWNMLEGNVKIYIDGEATASWESSGTEDYFLNGFYFTNITSNNEASIKDWRKMFHGCYKKDATTYSCGMYRWHLPDPIPFDSHVKVTWTNGEEAHANCLATDIRAVAFYYLDA